MVRNDAPVSTTHAHGGTEIVPTTVPDDRALQSQDLNSRSELFATADTDSAANKKRRVAPNSEAAGVNTTNSGEARYLRMNYDYIREIVMHNLSFPVSARKRRLSGRIEVSFIVGMDGRVEDIHLDSSSGHALLDMNVTSVVRRSALFPTPQQKARITLPIVFRLR